MRPQNRVWKITKETHRGDRVNERMCHPRWKWLTTDAPVITQTYIPIRHV